MRNRENTIPAKDDDFNRKQKIIAEHANANMATWNLVTLEFEEEARGKTVWFCLRWENTRGEKGPWSEFLNAIVP
jgi:hypothetical protein